MSGPGSIGRKNGPWLGAIALAVLLAALVMLIGRSLSPGVGRAEATVSRTAGVEPGDLTALADPAPQPQIIVVRTDSDGELECTIPSRREGPDGPMLYHWTGTTLQMTPCRVSASGLVGLGP